MDALTHCIETYLSPLVNPPADAIALDGVERAARWIAEATSNGRSREARWNMMMASTEGALTFQKGLGAVHAMAHPLRRRRRARPRDRNERTSGDAG
jgi:4-hydroxybutyrate dehydrogenase